MIFLVETIDGNGYQNRFLIDQESISELLKELTRQQTTPLSIREVPPFFALFIPSKQIKISSDEVIELIESLHLVIKSGLPLHTVLLDLAEDATNPRFKKMLTAVAEEINN